MSGVSGPCSGQWAVSRDQHYRRPAAYGSITYPTFPLPTNSHSSVSGAARSGTMGCLWLITSWLVPSNKMPRFISMLWYRPRYHNVENLRPYWYQLNLITDICHSITAHKCNTLSWNSLPNSMLHQLQTEMSDNMILILCSQDKPTFHALCWLLFKGFT